MKGPNPWRLKITKHEFIATSWKAKFFNFLEDLVAKHDQEASPNEFERSLANLIRVSPNASYEWKK